MHCCDRGSLRDAPIPSAKVSTARQATIFHALLRTALAARSRSTFSSCPGTHDLPPVPRCLNKTCEQDIRVPICTGCGEIRFTCQARARDQVSARSSELASRPRPPIELARRAPPAVRRAASSGCRGPARRCKPALGRSWPAVPAPAPGVGPAIDRVLDLAADEAPSRLPLRP